MYWRNRRVYIDSVKCSWALLLKGQMAGGSLGRVGALSPVLLPHVIGQVRYGRGRKCNHKCWTQSLGRGEFVML